MSAVNNNSSSANHCEMAILFFAGTLLAGSIITPLFKKYLCPVRCNFITAETILPSCIILSHLNFTDLRVATKVCREWNSIIKGSKSLQKKLILGIYKEWVLKTNKLPTDHDIYSIVKIEAMLDLPEAIETAKKIQRPYFLAKALCLIAIADPQYLPQAKIAAEDVPYNFQCAAVSRKIAMYDRQYEERAKLAIDQSVAEFSCKISLTRHLIKSAALDPHYFELAKVIAEQNESSYHRAKQFWKIFKAEVKHNPKEAKNTAERISHPIYDVRAYMKLAKHYPEYVEKSKLLAAKYNNCLNFMFDRMNRIRLYMKISKFDPEYAEKAKKLADESSLSQDQLDQYYEARALLAIAKHEFKYLERVKTIAESMKQDSFRDKLFRKIAKFEMRYDLYQARSTVTLIGDSYQRQRTLASLLHIENLFANLSI